MTNDRRVREFLQEFRRASAERSAAEQADARARSESIAAAQERFEKARAEITREWEVAREAARRESLARTNQIEEEITAELAQIQREHSVTVRAAEEELRRRTEAAEKEHQEATWTREAVYDAQRKELAEKLTTARRALGELREAVHQVRAEVAALLKRWGLIPRGVDGRPPDDLNLSRAAAEVSSRLKLAREQTAALGRLWLPGLLVGDRPLYAGIGLWLICAVAAVGACNAAGFDIGLSLFGGLTLGTCATVLIGIPLRRWVIRRADRQVRATCEPLHRALAEAEVLISRGEHYEQAVHDEAVARLTTKYDAEKQAADLRHRDELTEQNKQYERGKNAANAKRTKWAAVLEERRTLELEKVSDALEARLQELETKFQGRLAQVARAHDAALAKAEREHEERFGQLSGRWHDALARLWDMYSAVIENNERHFPDWSAEGWLERPMSETVPDGMRFGSVAIDSAKLPGGLPVDERLKKFVPVAFQLPVLLPFPVRGATLIRASGDGRGPAALALEAIMLRFLTAIPPGKVRFTIIDPVGLGKNFDTFRHLADYDEQLVGARSWTEPQQIERRLTDLTEHMENVIQKYLRGEYASIEEYNAKAGEVAEPYRVLVVANFPANFTPEAARRLDRIAANGAACGVFTLVTYDERQPLPQGYEPDDLIRASLVLKRDDGRFVWDDADFKPYPLSIDPLPPRDVMQQALHRIGARAKHANKVEVDFSFIAPRPESRWASDSRGGIDVPLGRAGATKRQHLRLGHGTAQHVLVAGKTGSGKSTLLHALITNLALHYSPREIELYLIDFKKGVEFMTYARNRLPHARVVAVESEREFGLSVLQKLDAELKRRGELYRYAGCQDVAGYRAATGLALPRILLIVDEFQEFFVEDDKLAQEATLLLDRLVRQGRAFGLHVLLGSQTLGGAYSLARSTIDQMAVRIALQCSEADANLILSKDNTAARLLSRPGEAIYNDANGLSEGNDIFQVVWLPDERRDEYLAEVRSLAEREQFSDAHTVVFEGNIPSELSANALLRKCSDAGAVEGVREWSAWLGDAMAIKEPTAAVFRRQSGSNLMMIGQQDEAARALTVAAILSALAQGVSGVVLLDGTPADDPNAHYFREFIGRTPGTYGGGTRDVDSWLRKLSAELMGRQSARASRSPILVAVYGLHRFRGLRKEDDDYGFGRRDAAEMKLSERFTELLREGPLVGIHTICWCDTLANINRTLERGTLREFEMRVLFPMGATDSSTLIDSPMASRLGPNRALFAREDQGQPEKFRPYRMPDDGWLSQFVSRLSATEEPFLDRASRVADADLPSGQIPEDGRAGTDHGSFADGDPGSDERIGGDPNVVANDDGGSEQGKVEAAVVMSAGAQVSILANHDAVADHDGAETIQDGEFADDRVGPHGEIPRDFDGDGGADSGGRMDSSTEQTEDPIAPAEHRPAAPSEERGFDEIP